MGFLANMLGMNADRFQGRNVQKQKLFAGINTIGGLTKFAPVINLASKALINTGLLHKITGGKSTKFFKGLVNFISPDTGIKSNYASQIQQAGSQTATSQMLSNLKNN